LCVADPWARATPRPSAAPACWIEEGAERSWMKEGAERREPPRRVSSNTETQGKRHGE